MKLRGRLEQDLTNTKLGKPVRKTKEQKISVLFFTDPVLCYTVFFFFFNGSWQTAHTVSALMPPSRLEWNTFFETLLPFFLLNMCFYVKVCVQFGILLAVHCLLNVCPLFIIMCNYVLSDLES